MIEKDRRIREWNKSRIVKHTGFSRKIKLPKELWKKGKSKFLTQRLFQEDKKNLAELYS
jgi:hypothetical protein